MIDGEQVVCSATSCKGRINRQKLLLSINLDLLRVVFKLYLKMHWTDSKQILTSYAASIIRMNCKNYHDRRPYIGVYMGILLNAIGMLICYKCTMHLQASDSIFNSAY